MNKDKKNNPRIISFLCRLVHCCYFVVLICLFFEGDVDGFWLGASANSYRSLCSNSSSNRLDYGQISPNGKQVYFVGNLAMVRNLEAQGIPSKHAEAIVSVMTQLSNESRKTMSQCLDLNAEVQEIVMAQEAKFSKLKYEVQSSQVHHFSLLECETEKLRNDIEKLCCELSYKMDNGMAKQRLDLKLEIGRIHDKLANLSDETTQLIRNLNTGMHELRADMAGEKYNALKNCIWAFIVFLYFLGILQYYFLESYVDKLDRKSNI